MAATVGTQEEIMEVERHFVEEAWNRGNLDFVDETHRNDLVVHWSRDMTNRPELTEFIRTCRTAFPTSTVRSSS